MALTAREAGEQVGKTRQAIIKAIRKGTLSAAKDESGEWRIDPAELFRVYPPVSQVDDTRTATESASDTAGLRREIEVLRERLAEKDGLIDDLREDRDRWREQATRLLPALQPAVRQSWWRRLRGK
jgi:hypothetical protein